MKRKILAVFLALCMSMSLVACNGGGTSSTTSGSTESGAEASGTTAETPENFNAEGMPIVNEEITVDTWVEGGTDIDWATATERMNSYIASWNRSWGNRCTVHFEQTGNNPPTLVQGKP